MQHIRIITMFDITNTQVVRNLKKELLPMTVAGVVIETENDWLKCRRQQSNWETLLQVISLRTQPMNISTKQINDRWYVDFDIEHPGLFQIGDQRLGLLKEDCNNLPLLTGLDETEGLMPFIIPTGPNQNTMFTVNEI